MGSDEPPILSPPRQPAGSAAGSYPGSPELLYDGRGGRIVREAAAPQHDNGAPLDGPGFTGEAQLFSRPAAAAATTETDGAEPPPPAADELPWKYVGAASVELCAFEQAVADGGGAVAAMVRVSCRAAPTQATVLTRRSQLTVREGCFVCFAARAAHGARPAELGLRFRSRDAVKALLGAFEALLSPPMPRADPATNIVNVNAHSAAAVAASATQALHAEARKQRASPLSPLASRERAAAASAAASPTSPRASLLPREDAEAMRKQQLLQRRAEAAELEAQRLGALLADAEGEAIRLRHQLEEVQAQLLARDAKIAALTRRQLLAANVKSPGK